MKKLFPFITLTCFMTMLSGQSIDLTFTAIENESYVQLDSIKIMNRTQACDTVLYWPDTVLSITYAGVDNYQSVGQDFQLLQNYPNPAVEQTMVSVQIPQKDRVRILVTDLAGRSLIQTESVFLRGVHTFRFKPGNERQYIFTVEWKGHYRSIKILSLGNYQTGTAGIEYMGMEGNYSPLKETKDAVSFNFMPGDELLYICYAGEAESGMHDTPEASQSYSFQCATNIPCPGMPTLEYGGQVYNTIQICSQCWLKENLNIGEMINAPDPQTNNDTIEKYCMGNMNYYCVNWGGLYFWGEVMNYNFSTGGRGICPEGWHIPCELDWQILEGVADSKYGIGDPIWNNDDFRGLDAGGHLKQTGNEYWEPPNTGATDAYGFTAFPGGYFVQNEFWGPGYKGIYWTSGPPLMFIRNMDFNEARIRKDPATGGFAGSVRCLKD
jgi:uncharacterized protein (TIGR02145 family)